MRTSERPNGGVLVGKWLRTQSLEADLGENTGAPGPGGESNKMGC